jgi:hypothetical protein
MIADAEEIERQAEDDLAATGQHTPPFRPSVVLLQRYGIPTERGGGRPEAILLPGAHPRCVIPRHLGSAQGRLQCGHETGHVARGHVNPHAIFEAPASYRGRTLTRPLEHEAQLYGMAITMPRSALAEAYADGPTKLETLVALFDVPETDLRRRLRDVDLWRLTYTLRSHNAYIASGYWKQTRRPRYLDELARRQGLPHARCERPGCRRLAHPVNHLHYETRGREDDTDLEALCDQHHYEEHVSRGRIA